MTETTRVLFRRLVACLFGSVVLAMMIGRQKKTFTDFGISFRHAVLAPHIVVFLLIGLLIFTLITFWPLVVPYLTRPGVTPLAANLLAVIIAQTVMNWYDPLASSQSNNKFDDVRNAINQSNISTLTSAFFDYLGWALLNAALMACGTAIMTRMRALDYVTALIGVADAVLAYLTHKNVVDLGDSIDHSLDMFTDVIGFLVLAAAGVTAVHSRVEVADTRGFLHAAMAYRANLPFIKINAMLKLLALLRNCWFAPNNLNDTLAAASSDFSGTNISSLASQYLSWLGWTLFAVCAVLAFTTTYLSSRPLT